MPNLASITVVVPTRNEAGNIPAFLDSVPAKARLLVVDASDDDTVAVIERLRPRNTRILRYPGSVTEARQAGTEAADTPYLLFTDADVAFHEDYFDRLATLECPVIYGPKLSRDRFRSYYTGIATAQRVSARLGIPAASGSNLLVERHALLRAGGFDTRLACNEDSELVWRLKRNGNRCHFDPDLIVWATDHRRLERGRLRKTAHSMLRCTFLYTGVMPKRWRESDWGYWDDVDTRV